MVSVVAVEPWQIALSYPGPDVACLIPLTAEHSLRAHGASAERTQKRIQYLSVIARGIISCLAASAKCNGRSRLLSKRESGVRAMRSKTSGGLRLL